MSGPSFVVGESYLSFMGQAFTRRSFEKITSVNGAPNGEDKWLLYVEAKLKGVMQAR